MKLCAICGKPDHKKHLCLRWTEKQTTAQVRAGYDAVRQAMPSPTPVSHTPSVSHTVVSHRPVSHVANSTYRYRDAERRRAYQRELMRRVRGSTFCRVPEGYFSASRSPETASHS